MYENNNVKIIFNPNAHSGEAAKLLHQLVTKLDEHKVSYTIFETKKQKNAIELSRQNVKDNDIVLIVGGDGTVYETINGTANKKNVKYCIIPAGTGNDLYCTMNDVFSIEEIIKSIRSNRIRKCNTISINEKVKMSLFLAYGIVIDIIMQCRKTKKKNHFCYLKAAAKSVFFHKPTQFEYTIEDGKSINVIADYIGIHNSSRAGGGMIISPFSSIDDDIFELIILEYVGIFRRILNFIAMVRKDVNKQPNYKTISCKKATIKSIQDEMCCVDGEIFQSKEIVAEIDNKSIEFFV